jgi:hypothetical protein
LCGCAHGHVVTMWHQSSEACPSTFLVMISSALFSVETGIQTL